MSIVAGGEERGGDRVCGCCTHNGVAATITAIGDTGGRKFLWIVGLTVPKLNVLGNHNNDSL